MFSYGFAVIGSSFQKTAGQIFPYQGELSISTNGVLTWNTCRFMIGDQNDIIDPLETPDIDIFAYTTNKNKVYLCTINIIPYTIPVIVNLEKNKSCSYSSDINTLSGITLYCQLKIQKCLNGCSDSDIVVPFYQGIYLTLISKSNSGLNINTYNGENKFGFFRISYSGSNNDTINFIVKASRIIVFKLDHLKQINSSENFSVSSIDTPINLKLNYSSLLTATGSDTLNFIAEFQNPTSYLKINCQYGFTVIIYFYTNSAQNQNKCTNICSSCINTCYYCFALNVGYIINFEIISKPIGNKTN